MKLNCSNLKFKKETFDFNDSHLHIIHGDQKQSLKVKNKFFSKCTLKKGKAELIIDLVEPYNKKNTLFFYMAWTHYGSDSEEDDEIVNGINDDIVKRFQITDNELLQEDTAIEARVEKTFDLSKVYFSNTHVVSPNAKFIAPRTFDAAFCERLTSYTKTFDLTMVKDKKTIHFTSIPRKQYFATIKKHFSSLYETGPDPLPWKLN